MGFRGEAREPTGGWMFPNTPVQHAEVLHLVKANGKVFVARRSPSTGKWSQNPYQPWELDAVLYDASGAPDTYVSMNRFRARRKVLQQHLRELTALYADIDYYDVPEVVGRAPEAVLELALGLLQGAGIPEPSLALYSGRGLYLVWLHKPLGWEMLPRWQDCQYRIWRVLEPMGADPKARDAARVLRLVGTTSFETVHEADHGPGLGGRVS